MITKMTAEEHKMRTSRSYKLLLVFAIVSMTMMFAGVTSALVVSQSREDWMKDFHLPNAFFWSTLTILLSSLTIFLAVKAMKKNNRNAVSAYLAATLGLGCLFVFCQFAGFRQIVEMGYYFTGPESNIATTFLYVIAILHLAHLAGGLIALSVVIYNHFKQKYNSGQTLGIELCAIYWHFLDFLWVGLFLFLYFFK
jgi:cytochrome c oxidase subunit 3